MFSFSKPTRFHLVVASLVSLPFLIVFIHYCLISSVLTFVAVIPFMLVCGGAFAFIGYFIDNSFKTAVSKYIFVILVVGVVTGIIWIPITKLLEAQSKRQATLIIEKVNNFKNSQGHFPGDLNDDFFKGIPKRSFLGTKYFYSKEIDRQNNQETFHLKFRTILGEELCFGSQQHKWVSFD